MSQDQEKRSTVRVIVHSFFVVPFLIAVFAVLILFIWRLLTEEPRDVEDYLADIKTGSATKRWQSAYELSRILANPGLVPRDDRFVAQMLSAFDFAQRDPDPEVRRKTKQYLIRAMGSTGMNAFSRAIEKCMDDKDETVVADAVYSLGLIGGEENLEPLVTAGMHGSSLVRNRAAIALGILGNPAAIETLRSMLTDTEANVRWNAAVGLAKLGDDSGRSILLDLLNRSYLERFDYVDEYEKTEAMLAAIAAASLLNDSSLNVAIRKLSEHDVDMKVRTAAMRAL